MSSFATRNFTFAFEHKLANRATTTNLYQRPPLHPTFNHQTCQAKLHFRSTVHYLSSLQRTTSRRKLQHFREELVQDARQMSKILDITPACNITPEQLCLCVGIEPFVTPGLARRVQDMKRKHITEALKEQRIQRQRGEVDVEALCGVSKRSSRWARSRAWKLADGYSKL